MSFIATLVLVFILVFRPQEIWPFLEAFRLLDVFTGLAALGVVVDFATGKLRYAYTPQLPFLAAFVLISYFATGLAVGREGLTIATTRSLIAAVFMIVVTYGARSVFRLRVLATLLVVLAIFVSGVAVHQGQVEPQCIEMPADIEESAANGVPDGRSCETAHGCEKDGRPGVDYECERLGLFKTVSTQRRVRWRGQLGDPNELSVYIGAIIPLILVLATLWRNRVVTVLAWAMIGLGLYAVVLTQSRGGQLVVGAVFAFYFIGRFGWKGVLVAGVVALPVILLGGREGEGADSSADERIQLLFEGVSTFIRHPVFGVGIDQFVDLHRQTAHNAYLLAATELGFPGLFVWSGLVWMSVKIPIAVVRNPPPELDSAVRALAMALIVSFVGMAIGIFFLSFTYKQLLFVWLGMAGALYGVVRDFEPDFEVRFERRDFMGLLAFDGVLLAGLYVYTRLKG